MNNLIKGEHTVAINKHMISTTMFQSKEGEWAEDQRGGGGEVEGDRRHS